MYLRGILKYIDKHDINSGINFTVKDGELIEYSYDGNILTGPSKIREQFIWAEKERIKEAYKIAQKNLYEPEKILTRYEKKLVLEKKHNKIFKRDKK